jgi:hypothetical protein
MVLMAADTEGRTNSFVRITAVRATAVTHPPVRWLTRTRRRRAQAPAVSRRWTLPTRWVPTQGYVADDIGCSCNGRSSW